MSRRTKLVLACLLAAVVLAVGGLWWLHTFKRVERLVDLPRTGEARINPLYALKVALQKDGVQVQARRRLQLSAGARDEPAVTLGPRDTVVIYNDPRSVSEDETYALLDWVDAGGHLVVRTPPAGLLRREGEVPLFAELELLAMDEASAACADLRVAAADAADEPAADEPASDTRAADDEDPIDADEDAQDVLFCDSRRFTLDGANPTHALGDLKAGYVFARVPYGEGSVDVLADLDFMSTEGLDAPASHELTRQLLAPRYRQGTVHLIYAAQLPSLWTLLARRSWMAWAPLLLALGLWLWRRMQRFGPELAAPSGERRSLLEHIVASGEHAYRYGYAHLLHAAVREAFLGRLRRRDPQAAALQGEPQLALLQARYPDVPAAEIRDALMTPFANDPTAFRSRIATLIRLRNRL